MADDFIAIYDELMLIRKYLIKKGQSRYTCSVTLNKLEEAKILYEKARLLLSKVKYSVKPELYKSIIDIYDNIYSLFLEISQLCTLSPSEHKSKTMEFDIKTACNLIPLLDDKENTTKRLIDAVEMYAEMLNSEGKNLLIKFVLKGRLSENAKLRMSDSYSSVTDLIKDLRKHLLTTKSFTAIQSRLQNTNQGWRSVDEYGTEIEKLFTDLTISQADGDSKKYAVLKPLNEKLAVKIFSDGLKSSRTSTIVAARNYDSLKDAIQAAKDEEVASPSTSAQAEVLQYSRGMRSKAGRYRYLPQPRIQGHRTSHRNFQPRDSFKPTGTPAVPGPNRGRFYNNRGGYFRGNSPRRSYWRGNRRNIFSAQPTVDNNTVPKNENTEQNEKMQFFRE